ncbi:hypothetical protein [Komagataeibacter swingsii]|uniref:Uncharacterized protein n=1 Tax=Komagataeibacter swingsii TaxID=215220 RepID=A0A850NZU6_9PROT|nr:hypothetical protein [Komagataeibacter swingsii]NVN36764.1 hypothetical protein [Komagataeibacter swingsii]
MRDHRAGRGLPLRRGAAACRMPGCRPVAPPAHGRHTRRGAGAAGGNSRTATRRPGHSMTGAA